MVEQLIRSRVTDALLAGISEQGDPDSVMEALDAIHPTAGHMIATNLDK